MDFRDNDVLMAAIEEDMKDMVRDVGVNILEMMRDSIAINVYEAYDPQEYERSPSSKGFIGSWEDLETVDNKNEINILIHSEPTKMIFNPKKFQHGNDFGDRRSYMDQYIQEGGGYDFMSLLGIDNFARDYFNPVIDELDATEFTRLFIQKLHHYGIDNFQFKI